jgi:exonuclease III
MERQLAQGAHGSRGRLAGARQPDILLMQETKLSDDDAPLLPFRGLATSCCTMAKDAGTAWPLHRASH